MTIINGALVVKDLVMNHGTHEIDPKKPPGPAPSCHICNLYVYIYTLIWYVLYTYSLSFLEK
jgi:hypothetical protein